MYIGIIGAGNIGGTLARKLAIAGHSIKLAGSKGPESVREKAEAIGAEAVSAQDVVNGVDAIILSVPFAAIPSLADIFHEVSANVPVLDTGSYYPFRDERIEEVEEGKPESVWVGEHLSRPITKVCNAVMVHTQQKMVRRQALTAGSPSRSRATMSRAGGLRISWSIRPASTPSTPAILTSPGVSSPARQPIAQS